MRGILLVNRFLRTEKFGSLYTLLQSSAESEGIRLDLMDSGEFERSFDTPPKSSPDFVLFWDKDILLARVLEGWGIRLFNSADAVEACDNKAITALKLQQAKVPTPRTYIAPMTFEGVGYNDTSFAKEAVEKFGYPVIVKEFYGSFGAQVYLAKDKDELDGIIAGLGHKGFIIQEFIKSSAGKDIRVNVVGGKVVSSILRYNPDGDFRSNITNGGLMKNVSATEEQCELAVRACEALGLDFAGVDILLGDKGALVCEVNSNPHFKTTLECTGKDMSLDIMKHIKESLL